MNPESKRQIRMAIEWLNDVIELDDPEDNRASIEFAVNHIKKALELDIQHMNNTQS